MMRIKILGSLSLFLPLIFSNTHVLAEKSVEKNQVSVQIETKKLDGRTKILSEYLARFNSPLQYHAQDFIDASQVYGLDWRMLPAIAGVESTFGKQIPGGFNAWGWGVYGSQAIYFKSWRDGIFTIARGLRENYLNRGLTDPYSMNKVYASSPYWGGKVSFFMQDMEKFAINFEADKNQIAYAGKTPEIAVGSGKLALR